MDLFKLHYNDENIDIYINEKFPIKRIKHYEAYFELRHNNSCTFQDRNGNQWIFTHGQLMINFQRIEIGTYEYSDGRTITRTPSRKLVIKQAEKYFLPLAVKEGAIKINLNLRKEDSYFYLN